MSYTCYHYYYDYYYNNNPLGVVLYHITSGRFAVNKTFGFSSLSINYLKHGSCKY